MISENYYFQICLRRELAKRCDRNAKYSLRSFASSLEVSPSTLSRLFSGKKIPTFTLAEKILRHLSLAPDEETEFWCSIHRLYNDSGRQRIDKEIRNKVQGITKSREKDLTPEVFRIISDWYHYAILQLIETEGFVNNQKWISCELGISEMEAKLALKRLSDLGLIEEKKNSLTRTTVRLTTGDLSLTNSALKRRIKQVTQKSIESLEHDSIEKRNHTTMTMGIDPDKIPMAKEMIQDFMDQLSEVLESKHKQVYELQINLFPLQRGD